MSLQRDDITREQLSGVKLLVFGGPRDKFTAAEVREEDHHVGSHTHTHTHARIHVHTHSLKHFEATWRRVEAC